MSNPQFATAFRWQHLSYRIDKFLCNWEPTACILAFAWFAFVISSSYFARPNTSSRAGVQSQNVPTEKSSPILQSFDNVRRGISTSNGANK